MEKLKHLDLFSGIGGFALSAEWAGFETVAFCEKDKFCQQVLFKHWPNVIIYPDIKTMDFTDHVDLITGGLPCQPFSVAGKRKGKEDDRYLWPEFYRIIKSCKPNYIVIENVVGIVAMELDNILADLENEGYETGAYIIPACAANAPHRRDRLWIVANRNGKRCDNGSDTWQRGHLQNYEVRNIAQIQSEWEKFKPKSWSTYTAENWFSLNFNSSGANDGISSELDRVKAIGNAIAPQIAYVILKMIKEITLSN